MAPKYHQSNFGAMARFHGAEGLDANQTAQHAGCRSVIAPGPQPPLTTTEYIRVLLRAKKQTGAPDTPRGSSRAARGLCRPRGLSRVPSCRASLEPEYHIGRGETRVMIGVSWFADR